MQIHQVLLWIQSDDCGGASVLNLTEQAIEDSDLPEIVHAVSQSNIKTLILAKNQLTDKSARELAKLTGIKALHLEFNQLGDEAAKALAAGDHAIEELFLGDNQIGIDGAKAFANKCPALKKLDLRGNGLCAEGLYQYQRGIPVISKGRIYQPPTGRAPKQRAWGFFSCCGRGEAAGSEMVHVPREERHMVITRV